MCDALLSRRQLLRYAALVSATYPAVRLLDSDWALAREVAVARPGLLAIPMNLDLVTVSDTHAVMTWFTGDPTDLDEFGRPRPVSAPGRVLIGTNPDPSTWRVVGEHAPTAYHYVEVSDLAPGTTYHWRAESNGQEAMATVTGDFGEGEGSASPRFTTQIPPSGRPLGQVAWLNDLHFGEQISGLLISVPGAPRGGVPPGFPVDPENPYWRTMSRAAVAESKARGCRLLLANGDLTNEAEPEAVAEARSTLDVFGELGLGANRTLTAGDDPSYFVTRGNHDRAHQGEMYDHCSPVAGHPDLHDCFHDAFVAGYEKDSTHFSVAIGDDRARFRFVGLDSSDLEGRGYLSPGELEYMEAEFARGDATIPMFHHPVTSDDGFTGVSGPEAEMFRSLVRNSPNTAAVYSGHTHKNQLGTHPETGSVPLFEGGAVKEYPGGYTTVRLYENGLMVNFWKSRDPEALAWSERSRGQYLGAYPGYALGHLSERNWSHSFDARVPAGRPGNGHAATSVTMPPPTSGESGPGALAATGPGSGLGTGLALLGTGAALAAGARRSREGAGSAEFVATS